MVKYPVKKVLMMSTQTLTYGSYIAEYQWDDDCQRFVARIIDIDAIIHFEGEQELLEEMGNSIADYKEFLQDLSEMEE